MPLRVLDCALAACSSRSTNAEIRTELLQICVAQRCLRPDCFCAYKDLKSKVRACNLKALPEVSEEQGLEIEWKKSATPLTVKQVLRASRIHSRAPFELDGRELGDVYCVGNIVDIKAEDTFFMLYIEDSSAGRLAVFLFMRKEFWGAFKQLVSEGAVKEHMYVRVHGEVSGDNNFRNSIIASRIVPVEDYHEIFFHLLECALVAKRCKALLSKQRNETEQSNDHGTIAAAPRPSVGGVEEKDKGRPPSPELPVVAPADDSSEDEIEYASEHAASDDGSDEERSEIGAEDDSSSDDDSHRDVHVEISTAQAQVQALTIDDPGPEAKVSEQELDNVQATLQSLRLTSADRSNSPGTATESSDSERHIEADRDPLSELTNIQRALVLHISRRREEIWAEGEEVWNGLRVSELALVLRRQKKDIAASEISATLDDLMDDGYIFPTIDEFHFDVYEF